MRLSVWAVQPSAVPSFRFALKQIHLLWSAAPLLAASAAQAADEAQSHS